MKVSFVITTDFFVRVNLLRLLPKNYFWVMKGCRCLPNLLS